MRRRQLNRLHGKGNTKRLLYAGSRRQIQLRRRYLVSMKKNGPVSYTGTGMRAA
jgi:hypothetical protein